jgi:spore coat polysaccharide biosynthesis predicted glycosyltransferase SpsG
MKVLFLTEGGKSTGFGHITRCIGLAQGFYTYAEFKREERRRNKADIEFIIKGDKKIEPLFRGENFKIQFFDWIKNYKNLQEKIKKADFIVIDSYLAPYKVYNYISARSPYKIVNHHSSLGIFNSKLICIDDSNRLHYPPSTVINPSLYGDSLPYPKDSYIQYLLGKQYLILRKEFWKCSLKRINKKIENVLIVLSGREDKKLLKEILNILTNLKLENPLWNSANLHVVTYSEHSLNFNSYSQVIYYPNSISAQEIRKLMDECDIAISGGGVILYELAKIGLATVGICVSNNQLKNLEFFKKKNI